MAFGNWSLGGWVGGSIPLSPFSPDLTSFMRPLCLVTMVREKEGKRWLNLSLVINYLPWVWNWGLFSFTHQTPDSPSSVGTSVLCLSPLRWLCDYLAVGQVSSLKWSLGFLPTCVSLAFNPPIFSFDLSALYLVTLASSELKEFLAQARGGAIRVMKIVIRNGTLVSFRDIKSEWFWFKIRLHLTSSKRADSCFVCRGVGAGFSQTDKTELGQRLWSVPATSAHATTAVLHPLPPGLPECTGIWMDLHCLVTWPITSTSTDTYVPLWIVSTSLKVMQPDFSWMKDNLKNKKEH